MHRLYRVAMPVVACGGALALASAPLYPGGDVAFADARVAARSDEVKVNEFLSYDPTAKRAALRLVGGHDKTNNSLNFNGGANGAHTITIPLGWTVRATFRNADRSLPHSAIVVEPVTPIPAVPPEPAFARAYTMKLEEGLRQGATDDVTFKASAPGKYWIMCGVPGHGVGGMYITLQVSQSATAPTYSM